jgi:branched-chain amino acid transport system permease protein
VASIIQNGLVTGAVYGVIALGIVLIYRNSKTINFAYPETGMMGGFTFLSLWSGQHVPYFLAAAIGLGVSTAVGAATYLLLIRLQRSTLNMVIGTLSVAFGLQYVAARIWSANPRYSPSPFEGFHVSVFSLTFAGPRLEILIVSAVTAIALLAFFRLSRWSQVFRAAAGDPYAAQVVGINTTALSLATWSIGGLLAGVAAILVAPLVVVTTLYMTNLLVRALAAALLVRLSSAPGALVAGLVIGLFEATLSRWVSQVGTTEAIIGALLIGMMMLQRPGLPRRTA